MPRIIDYPTVLEQMQRQQMRSLYHNSGAFGFIETSRLHHRGWIGPADPTLRPEAQALARRVIDPCEASLAQLAEQVWQQIAPGSVWVLPMSHWAYELDFGSRDWLPATLESLGVDLSHLQGQNTAPAIAFDPDETAPFRHLVAQLLEHLAGSDFALAFPGWPLRCTIHHHKQLWWTTNDSTLLAGIDSIGGNSGLLAQS